MDPDRVRSYLQAACAGLGFDIGEVWWVSDEGGTGTVASVTESAAGGAVRSPPKKRFLQLYTSKAYCDQRSKLVQPHDEVDAEFDAEFDEDDDADRRPGSSSRRLLLRREHPLAEDDEHVLSPRIVEAVTKSAQVVWANCLSSRSEGLLGRSDVKLQTAIGMPVGIDDAGRVWVVVMFSPNNVQSSSDAIEYLQYIGRSAGSSSIPCLLPVAGDGRGRGGARTIADGREEGGPPRRPDPRRGRPASVGPTPHERAGSGDARDILGEGVAAKFVSFNIRDDDCDAAAGGGARRDGDGSDLANAPKDDFGIPMLPPSTDTLFRQSSDPVVTDDFDEASYGVWSTIMNSADGLTIRTSITIASKMEVIRERLEEFLCAFLGMSVFDVGDAWVPSSADGVGGDAGGGAGRSGAEDTRKTLKCLFTAAATDSNPGINAFRGVSGSSSIQIGDGAVGKAFSSGYPVWSSDESLIYDSSRYQALENCSIKTIFAVPIFSAGDVSPSCILSCYSLLHSESVPFVINFVQKAVRLLWDGLDQIDPHESVGKVLWNNVGPSDLGEMAADMEMQKAFIGKKRPHTDVARRMSGELNDDPAASRLRSGSLTAQAYGVPDYQTMPSPVPFYPPAAPPGRGLAPAPLFPSSVMEPNSQQMVSVNFSNDGHWAVQQAVKSVGDVQLWNSSVDSQQYSNEQVQLSMNQEQNHLSQFQPLQYRQDFANPSGFAQPQQQQTYISSDSTTQPLSQPPNFSLSYVDYGLRPQSVEPNPSVPAPPAGVHVEHPSVIHANLMEFNAMAQMYSAPDTTHPSNELNEAPINYGPAPLGPAPSQGIGNIRVVPLSHAEGSVILTGPQQMMYYTANAQPVNVESMDQIMFSLETAKNCRIVGCLEPTVARKPYCSKHCGNRQCEREGCSKHAQGATRFCIAHGGGRRCTFPGCDKGARDRFFCAAHGGGKRCKIEGCSKSAVGGSHFCTSHGGGKRCKVEGCDKSAQSSTDFCVKHGGGKKCQFEGCEKVARGKTQFCAAHGGGIRCKLEGCNRVAIGKAQLCRAHGGGAARFKPMTFPPPQM